MSGKSKGIKKTIPPEEVMAMKRQQLEALQLQAYQVERMLGICTDQHNRLDAEHADVCRSIALTQQAVEDKERTLDDHVAFMKNYTRQNEEQLKARHERLVKSVSEAEANNAALRQKLAETQERKRTELRKWEDEADVMQHQMNEKALLFGMQLKESLEHMRT